MQRWLMTAAVILASGIQVLAQQERHDRLPVVPVAKAVTLDGDLKEWDLSGAFEAALDDKLRPLLTVRFAAMYDADAFYLGAHFTDDTPLVNRHDPAIEGGGGWAGDCLQMHLCSDVTQPYPLPGKLEAPTVCDVIMWHFTDKRQPVLYIDENWGKNQRIFTGADSGLAFKADKDKKGYALEARIPWSRLNAPRPPKAGESMALLLKPFWGDATGYKFATYFSEIIRQAGFAYADSGMWGRAEFLAQGHLAPQAKPKTGAEKQLPLTASLTLPDRKATTVSAALYNRAGTMVRTLLAGAAAESADQPLHGSRIVKRRGATVEVAWDGCDDAGKPLPVGEYGVKVLTSRGIGQKWVTSVHNAGNPPWNTDDDTGSWGGDHAPAVAVATDRERVYLLWAMAECGPALVACNPDGQKVWSAKSVSMDAGFGFYALATDGQYVYMLQDGYMYGQGGSESEARTCHPAIVRWEAATGKPVNFAFGKRCLSVGEWSDSLMLPDFVFKCTAVFNTDYCYYPIEGSRFKRTWEKLPTHDFGPQELARNAIGLAVHNGTAYVAKYLEEKVAAYDLATGKALREWRLPRPVGIAASADGTVYAVAGKGIVKLLPDGTSVPVVKDALSAPWGLALDKDGLLYVSDCGAAMQVKVFDPATGKPVRTIGKAGGRPWVGKFDPAGMLEPAGLALDRENKLWVCEYDAQPTRISSWRTDGTFLRDFFGPSSYSVFATVDEERPSLVCVHNTLFDVNYRTGAVKPVCTLDRDTKGLQFQPGRMHYLFRHVQGRTYAVTMGQGGTVVFRVTTTADGVPLAEPVAAWGLLNHLQFFGLWGTDIPKAAREKYWQDRKKVMYQWHDLNGDRLVQDDEWIFTHGDETVAKACWALYSGNWVDDDLTFWTQSSNNRVIALKVKEWRSDVPVYAPFRDVEPLFTLPGNAANAIIPDGDSLYLATSGLFYDAKGGMDKRRLNGDLVWTYGRAYPGLQSPLPVPGDLPSPLLYRSLTHTPDGLGLLFINGYYGQYFLLDTDGLYVGTLCKDTRTGPKGGPDVILMENFNGFFYRNKDNGRYYALGGDTDARIWEVTGIDSLRKGSATLTVRQEDVERSTAALRSAGGGAAGQAAIRIGQVPAGFKADDPAAWDMGRAVTWDAGAGRTAKVVLAHDATNLYALYQVADRSPMANGGKEWATLFKCGDTCEIMLGADPKADPKRDKPAAGDLRLLFSVMEGQATAVLYESLVRPGEAKEPRTFNSATRGEPFERVVLLKNAAVKVTRSAVGYVLTAAVPLADIGFALSAGLTTRGDVGVLFSNDGGTVTAVRSYYFNHNTGITGDLPSEARLQPADWGTVEVE